MVPPSMSRASEMPSSPVGKVTVVPDGKPVGSETDAVSVSGLSTVIVQTATGTSATASTAPGASAGTGTRTATDVTVTSGN